MNYFDRRRGELFCEKVPLTSLADKYGTPLYVYSLKTIVRHLRVVSSAFAGLSHSVFYSVKANSNLTLLRIIAELGYGCDVVSIGEYLTAKRAGVKRIIFSGVGKREDEIERALKGGVVFFGVESANELETIDKIAGKLKIAAPVSLRVNPDVNPLTHRHIATGLKKEKFGIPAGEAEGLYLKIKSKKWLNPVGISMHIGSQIRSVKPFVEASMKLKSLFSKLLAKGIRLRYFDLGGGWAAPYSKSDKTAMPDDYVRALLPHISGLQAEFIVEPGRSIIGNAGVLLARVIYIKQGAGKRFAVIDAGMNDFIRPALYGAHHVVEPVIFRGNRRYSTDVVGPICENADSFARGIKLQSLKEGDLLCIFTAGAYGFSMASNYNSRPKPAEVIVDDTKSYLIRERETVSDLWRKQKLVRRPWISPPIN